MCTILSLIFITLLSLSPSSSFPKISLAHCDLLIHFSMYLILTFSMTVDWILITKRAPKLKNYFVIPFISIGVGGAMEFFQTFTKSRTPSWLDFSANALGVVCAIAILLLLNKPIASWIKTYYTK